MFCGVFVGVVASVVCIVYLVRLFCRRSISTFSHITINRRIRVLLSAAHTCFVLLKRNKEVEEKKQRPFLINSIQYTESPNDRNEIHQRNSTRDSSFNSSHLNSSEQDTFHRG